MKIDLKKDEQTIRAYIKTRVLGFPNSPHSGPGETSDPIKLITLGYYLEQTGYFALVIDTRKNADSDGRWTLYIENEENVLSFKQWCLAFHHLCDGGKVSAVLPSGKIRVLDENDDNASVAKLFGEIFRDTMQSLIEEGTFTNIPLAKDAMFTIEEFDGNYGWPSYEERKTLGSLNK